MNRLMKHSCINWVGEVPQDWEIRTLSQFFSQVKNKNTDLIETNLLSLSYGKIVEKDINTKDGLLPENFEGYNIIESGDIVLRLTDLQNDHKSLRVGLSTQRGIITSAYVTLRKKSKDIDDKFAYYFLHSFDLSKGFYGMGAGVRQGLTFDGLKKMEFVLPSHSEQQKIANFLDEKIMQIDKIIENTKLSIEEFKKYKQSLITEISTKGLNPNVKMKDTHIEWIGSIPAHWEIRKVNSITEKITDFVASGSFESLRNNVIYLDKPDYAVLVRTVDLSNSQKKEKVYVSKESYEFLSNSNLFGGEIILPNIGASIGKVFIFEPFYDNSTLGPNSIMVNMKGNNRYFYYLFLSSLLNQKIKILDNSSAQEKFNKTQFRQLSIVNPPKEEQDEIAGYLDERCNYIDNIISKKEEIILNLGEYKKSLIYEYVTGKREVM